jgi:Holliday junction resolvasome RuvABC ATP-dependent DNA helicase subunit
LLKEGYIKRTPRGREVTERAYTALGLINDNTKQGKLF